MVLSAPYLVIENFKGGLDSRRPAFAATPGTLTALTNAHITRGGDIEKRKAFTVHSTLPGDCYGLEVTDAGLLVFGSSDLTVTNATYQRFFHPAVTEGTVYNAALHAMTELVSSSVYGGKAFALCKFADGHTYAYYDTTNVLAFTDGLAMTHRLTPTLLAQHLTNVLGRDSSVYTATVTSATNVVVSGPEGVEFALAATIARVTGSSASNMQATSQSAVEGITARQAVSRFRICGGSSTNSDSLTELAVGSVTNLLGTNVYWTGSRSTMAIAAANGVNSMTGSNGFTAVADGEWVWLYDASGAGDSNNNAVVTIKSAGVAVSDGRLAFGGLLTNDVVTSIQINAVELLSVPLMLWTNSTHATLAAFVTGLATNITASNAVHGYYAIGDGETLRFARKTVTSSDTALSISATVTRTGTNVTTSVLSETGGFTGPGDAPGTNYTELSFASAYSQLSGTVAARTLYSTAEAMLGGIDGAAGQAQQTRLGLGGTWAAGDTILLTLIRADTGDTEYHGAQRMAGVEPTFALAFKDRIYVTSSNTLYFSGLATATGWGYNDVGSGFVDVSATAGTADSLVALAVYQGRLAALGRRHVQVWTTDSDPANFTHNQTLYGIGTVAQRTVCSFGDVDVFFLSDSGIRSVRSRDYYNTATVSDVGTAIDDLVVGALRPLTTAQKAVACAVMEPVDGRYWCQLGSQTLVFSYFPGSSIAAWSTYAPSYKDGSTTVNCTPSQFGVNAGSLYLRATNTSGTNLVLLYGGTDGASYDNCRVTWQTPFLDAKTPATTKTLQGMDAGCEGTWQIDLASDVSAPTIFQTNVATLTQDSFMLGKYGASGRGTHFAARGIATGTNYGRFSMLILHYLAHESE